MSLQGSTQILETGGASPMHYRELGKTGLRVSVIGFGAAPLGDVYGRIDASEGTDAVRFAIDSGINLFDVSPYYGLTLAETRLGEALVGYRDRAIVATKCGRYGADDFDFSAARITAGVEDSLRRLKTDHVDVLQAHDVEFGHADQIVDETIPALRKLQEQGKARFIGITGLSLKNLAAIAQRAKVDCMISYCRYNLMISDMDDVLVPVAKAQGIGIINASPLHMGILTESGPAAWHPASKEIRDTGMRVAKFCKANGVEAPELALRYCLDHPYVSSTLIGMFTRTHVEANLRAMTFQIDPVMLGEIRNIIAPVYNEMWPSGLAENHG